MTERTAIPIPRWAPVAGGALALLVVVAIGARFGIGVSFVLLAGAALLTVVWMAFRAVQSIVEPSDEDDVEFEDAPTPAQVQKQAALRALRDLEYERSLGNILDDDFRELERRYREEAKRAMRAVDEERKDMRARAEALAAEVVGGAAGRRDERADEEAKAKAPEREPTPTDARVTCEACRTKNEPDAKFCKQCGAKMGRASIDGDPEEVAG